jgi:hypothetical protein
MKLPTGSISLRYDDDNNNNNNNNNIRMSHSGKE